MTPSDEKVSALQTYERCVYCGGEKTPPGKGAAKVYLDPLVYLIDPYCRRRCLELDRGIVTPEEDERSRKHASYVGGGSNGGSN